MQNSIVGASAAGAKKRVSAQIRRNQVLTLKLQGRSDRQIAELLSHMGIHISHVSVNLDWHRALDDLTRASQAEAERLRTLMMQRYERLLSRWWPVAIVGDLRQAQRATEMILQVLTAERRLYGLDTALGTSDNPIHIIDDTAGQYDLSSISNEDIDKILAIAEAQRITSGPSGGGAARESQA